MQRLVSTAFNFLAGGSSQGADLQTEQASTRDQAGSTDPATTLQAGLDGTNDLTGSKKRPISVGSPESGPRKKVDRRSDHEKRLTGDFTQPRTAKRLQVPGAYISDEHEESPQPKTMSYKPRGGHKPVNTLDQTRHGARPANPNDARFFKTYAKPNGIKKSDAPRQPAESLRKTSEAQAATNWVGDGFEPTKRVVRDRADFHPNKRQKLAMVRHQDAHTSPHVDLTEDDEVKITHLNGIPVKGSDVIVQNSAVARNPPPLLFGTAEVDRVHAMTQIQQKKRRRRSMDGQGSSQTSSRGASASAINGHSNSNGSMAQQILGQEIINDQQLESSASTRLPITLGEGIDGTEPAPSKASKNRRQAQRKQEKSESRPMANSTPRPGQLQKPSTGRNHQSMLNPATGTLHPSQHHPEKLRETFVRDEQPAAPRQRAPQRMKATSRGNSITDVDDSPDELARGTTVGSQASRSVSPAKRAQPRASGTVNARQGSTPPGELKPSNLRQDERSSRFDDLRAGRRTESKDEYHATNRVRLQAFYATSSIITSGDLMLELDPREKQFDLYHNGQLQVLEGKQKALSLTQKDIDSCTSSRDDHRVFLKGPAGGDISSTGRICIAFLDSGGVDWFQDTLMELSGDRLKVGMIPEEKFHKTFVKQVQDIQYEHTRQIEQHSRREVAAAARIKRGLDEEDEQIIYEPDSLPRMTPRQTAAGRLKQEAKSSESSPYFTNIQPRRSSRPTRQTKQHSPSPDPDPVEKWTEVNKPTRWNHSVVYPPEGLRRVTVDFQDLERLDEGEFLNDNIISYALRRIEENISPEHKDEVFFFNSFFYTALTLKNGRKTFNYDAVKRWTKNKDLFNLPYVVVPINIDLHWFVAIICNLPSVSRTPCGIDDEENDVSGGDGVGVEVRNVDSSAKATHGSANETPVKGPGDVAALTDAAPSSQTMGNGVDGVDMQAQTAAMDRLSISQEEDDSKTKVTSAIDDPTAEDSDIEVVAKSAGRLPVPKKSKKKPPPPAKKYDPDLPTIITLDSFGTGHSTETRNLKDYLKAEAEAKRSMDLDIKQLQGMTAKGIPEQTNFCDCGLYLVGYVEEFAKNPRQFVTKVLTRQLDKQADFASFNPSAKRDEIRNELLKLNEEQEAARKMKKSTKKTNAKGIADAPTSSPTPPPAKSAKEDSKTAKTDRLAKDARALQSKQSSAPATSNRDQQEFATFAEDTELEQCVPRALTEPAEVQKIETKTPPPPAEQKLENDDERTASDFEQQSTGRSTLATTQGIEGTPANDSEEMLDTADEPMDEPKSSSNAISGDATELAPGSDLMSGLVQELNKNSAELLHRQSTTLAQEGAARPIGKLHRPREKNTASGQSEVVNLDNDSSQFEIPESPPHTKQIVQHQ